MAVDNDDPGAGQPTPPPPASSTEPLKPDETAPTPAPQPSAEGPWQPQSGQPPRPKDLDQLDVFRDPGKLADAASIFLKNGDEAGLAWLQHVHTALQENGVAAVQALQAGDGDLAVKRFNQSGKYTDAKSASKNDDGTWTLTRGNGQQINIDPAQEAAALMSPAQYVDLQNKKTLIASEVERNKAMSGWYDNRLETVQNKIDADRQIAAARALAQVEAARVRGESAAAIRAAQQNAAEAQRQLNDRDSPTVTYNEAVKLFVANPEPNTPPEVSAMRVASRSPRVKPMLDPKTGAVHIVDRATGQPVFSFRDVPTAQQALPGLYIPQNPAPANTAPALSKPGNAPPAAPAGPARGIPYGPGNGVVPSRPVGRPFATGLIRPATQPDPNAP